jgi:hypothetical protein
MGCRGVFSCAILGASAGKREKIGNYKKTRNLFSA